MCVAIIEILFVFLLIRIYTVKKKHKNSITSDERYEIIIKNSLCMLVSLICTMLLRKPNSITSDECFRKLIAVSIAKVLCHTFANERQNALLHPESMVESVDIHAYICLRILDTYASSSVCCLNHFFFDFGSSSPVFFFEYTASTTISNFCLSIIHRGGAIHLRMLTLVVICYAMRCSYIYLRAVEIKL